MCEQAKEIERQINGYVPKCEIKKDRTKEFESRKWKKGGSLCVSKQFKWREDQRMYLRGRERSRECERK